MTDCQEKSNARLEEKLKGSALKIQLTCFLRGCFISLHVVESPRWIPRYITQVCSFNNLAVPYVCHHPLQPTSYCSL